MNYSETDPSKFRPDDPSPGPGDYMPKQSRSDAGKYSFGARVHLPQLKNTSPAANAYHIKYISKDSPGQYTSAFYTPTAKKKQTDQYPSPNSYNVSQSYSKLFGTGAH